MYQGGPGYPPYGQSPYGAAPPQAYPPSPYPQPYGPPVMVVDAKNPGIAAMLELLGGFFFQTFGVGHIYAGNVGVGVGLMFGYWFLTAINFGLCFILIGFITWPICWVAAMIISAITASNAAKATNQRMARGGY